MEWIMFLFGIVVLALGVATIYNAHCTARHIKDTKDKEDNKA